MKKQIVSILACILGMALLMSSCSSCNLIDMIKEQFGSISANDPTGDADEATPEEEKILSLVSGSLDLDTLSLAELKELSKLLDDEDNDLSALQGGAVYDLYYSGQEISGFDAEAEASFDTAEGAKTAVITDQAWVDKEWETLDITEGMSPEDKAAYQAAMAELENFDADAYQAEMDEMLQGMQGFEDYEPYTGSEQDPQVSNEWPDNEIGRQVPKPPFGNPMVTTTDSNITLIQTGAAISEVKAYAAEVKKAGFTVNANESDQTVAGISIYSFTAHNAAGYTIQINFTAGTVSIVLAK